MQEKERNRHIDYTALKAYTTWEEIKHLCEEAICSGMATVCIPSSYVKRVSEIFGEKLNVCTVIGFPLGNASTEAKVAETKQAVADGADEIDMVINIGEVKNGNYGFVQEEIRKIRNEATGRILKVIIETCYLSEEEKIRMAQIVTEVKADYIKTSTGFGTDGAKLEDIRLLKKHLGTGVKIKASGGIRTVEALEAFLNEGCDRIGASTMF
ncbi:MAG: deoxyribose-phosphate aldolase [Eubacterium sp.]|jgi:deoxyribose-phosphate aldolase|nr:deoxyribose-phosphate aldolase [Eubacterium sp.]